MITLTEYKTNKGIFTQINKTVNDSLKIDSKLSNESRIRGKFLYLEPNKDKGIVIKALKENKLDYIIVSGGNLILSGYKYYIPKKTVKRYVYLAKHTLFNKTKLIEVMATDVYSSEDKAEKIADRYFNARSIEEKNNVVLMEYIHD